MFLSIFTFLIFIHLFIKSGSIPSCSVRIYSNQAEIKYPLYKLPLEFTDDEWNDIRSDSITLLGQNINITSQIITETQKSLNGAEIYVRSPMSFDKSTLILVKGILIDETNNLVKIEDESIAGQQTLFFTVPSDHIFYLEQPSKAKFYVNFTYDTIDSKVHVSYLRSNLNWHTQYQLNLYDDDSTLIAMANIRNDGKSSILIDQAELIGGDINLHRQQSYKERQFSMKESYMMSAATSRSSNDERYSLPMIEQGNEIAGLYVFTISKPFIIDAKTNYLLPMFRPHVTVERYRLISKYFSTAFNIGKAQRSYRLTSDRFLSRGNCLIRELDRLVGEISLPDIAAKEKFEFSIGQDANIVYKENVTLLSSTTFKEGVVQANLQHGEKNVEHTRTRSVYEINVQITNFKTRSVTIEYEQKGFSGYQSVKLTTSNNHRFIQDSSSIKSNMTLNANDDQIYSYSIELIY